MDNDDADADSDEYVDTMDRRGGPNRKFIPVRPLPPDVVVPDNLDLPYADLSHLVSAIGICKNSPKKRSCKRTFSLKSHLDFALK